MAGDREPPLPMEIRVKSLFTPEDHVICTFISSHISTCLALQPPSDHTHSHTHQCDDAVCCYFKWFSAHRAVCKEELCPSCEKFKRWMARHSKDCAQSCGLEQCKSRKTQQLRDRLKPRNSRFMTHIPMTPNPTSNRTPNGTHHHHHAHVNFGRSISQPSHSPSPSPEPDKRTPNHHTIDWQMEASQLNGLRTNGHISPSHYHVRRIEYDWSATDPRDSPTTVESAYSTDKHYHGNTPNGCSNGPIERQPSISSAHRDVCSDLTHICPSRASIDLQKVNDFRRNMSITSSVNSYSSSFQQGTGLSVYSESCDHGDICEEDYDESMLPNRGVLKYEVQSFANQENYGSKTSQVNNGLPRDEGGRCEDPECSLVPTVTKRGDTTPLKYPLERQDTNPPEQTKLTLDKGSISFSHLKEIERVKENFFRSKTALSSDEQSTKKTGNSDSSDYYSSAPPSVPSSDQDTSDFSEGFSSFDEEREGMEHEQFGYQKQQSLNHKTSSSFLFDSCNTSGVNMEFENTSEDTVTSLPEHLPPLSNRVDSMSTICNSGSLSSPCTMKSFGFKTGSTGSYNPNSTMSVSTPSSMQQQQLLSDRHQQQTSQSGFSSPQSPLIPSSPFTHPHSTLHATFTHSPSHSTSGHIHPYALAWDRHQSISSVSETSSILDDMSMESSSHYHPSPRPSLLDIRPMSTGEVNEICERVDDLRMHYHGDIERLKNMGYLMEQQVPEQQFDESGVMNCSYQFEWDFDCDFCTKEILQNVLTSQNPKREEFYYNMMMESRFPENERQIRRQLDQQSDFRMYLINQFYNNRVYREGEHWRRKVCLGSGGQGSCFSIHDFETSLTLALKEAPENQKALKEAYVCLKLAHLSNASQNVLEYFSAALLPSNYLPGDNSFIQIFMEIMPTSFQSCLCLNGPMLLDHVHHYGYQLFDALDYLHSHGIIHCDIKPANILVDESAQRLKLADFGAAALTNNISSDGLKDLGTLTYNPPEYYSRSESGFAMDIWQAGCCLLAMSTGRRPWRHLFMDVLKGKQSADLTNEKKRQQRDLIGRQTFGHFYPTFLDEPLQKLLYGCLHADKASRPSAQDCVYMLVHAGATNDEQRAKVSQALKFDRSEPRVLRDFKMADSYIDVFLASRFEDVMVDGACHGMMPGWLGCVEYFDGMTYRQMKDSLFQEKLTVVRHFPPYNLAVSNCTPQEHFKNVSSQLDPMSLYRTVCLDSPVDPTKSLVIYKSAVIRTLC